MKKYLKKIVRFIYKIMAKLLPVNKDIIIFNSNVGRNYTGNPKAIYLEMERDERYRNKVKVWAFNRAFLKSRSYKNCEELADHDNTVVVKYGGLAYHRYLAQAGTWVFDGRQEDYYIKRKGVIYLQCWHGTPLKKLALDMESVNMAEEQGSTQESYNRTFLKESAKWDILLSQNPYSTEIFKRCFGYQGEILGNGYPRNDELKRRADRGDDGASQRGKKIILYAPTWRDDIGNGDGTYKFVTNLDFDRLADELGDSYVFLCKAHYLVADSIRKMAGSDKARKFVKIIDPNADISELYLRADILITDYSSAMFDYAVLKRPIILYTFDLTDYRDRLRGIYFDIVKDAPGPVAEDTEELINAIKYTAGADVAGTAEYKAFFDKFASFDDGQASKRVLDRLIELTDR